VSHELTEIEHFITHVAFMQNGRLLLQEAIETLHSRFREVTVTLSATKEVPTPYPDSWLLPELSGHRLRFVTSAFDGEQNLYQEMTQLFGAVRVSSEPLPLRTVANTLMQARKRQRATR
jgi:ABC-2 type transport system ATP-binding protein